MPTEPASPLDTVDVLLDFLNTFTVADPPRDVLDDPPTWARWCRDRGFDPGAPANTRSTRDALRDLVAGTAGVLPESPVDFPALPLTVHWAVDGPALAAPAGPKGPDAAGSALAAAVLLHARGRLGRVKICRAEDCGWAFYDQSRNASRSWCSMAICGNRAKTRAFRERSQPSSTVAMV